MNGAQAAGCSPVASAFAAGHGRLPPGQAGHDRQVAGDRQPGRRPLRARARAPHRRRRSTRSPTTRSAPGIRLLAETTGIFTETAGGVTTATLAKLAERGDIDPRRARRARHHRRGPQDARRRARHVRDARDRADASTTFEAACRRARASRSDGGHGQDPDAAARRRPAATPRPTVDGRDRRRGARRRSTTRYDELRDRISDDDGELRRFVNVYVGGEDIRFLDGLATPVADGDEVTILPAVAGG